MELSILLMKNIASLFIIMAIGYALVKLEVCKVEDSRILSSILLYVATPCAIINSFQIELSKDKISGFILVVIVGIVIQSFYIVITTILSKKFAFDAIEKTSIIYSNSANLIIPLVTAVLGTKMTFYACGYMMVQNVLLWTHCKFVISEEKKFNYKKILFNFNILAIILGISLFIFQIRLPITVTTALGSMGGMLGPLSMLVVGMLLTKVNILEIVKNKRYYFIVFLRLIALPSVILLFLIGSGIQNVVANGKEILLVSLLAACAPTASTVTQFAQIYNNEPGKASSINALSVLFCIVTMPIIIMIYMNF